MNRAKTLITTTILILLIAMTGSSLATNYYTSPQPTGRSRVGFSFLKPSMLDYSMIDYAFFSGSFLLNAHLNLSSRSALKIVIPFTRFGYEWNSNVGSGYANAQNTETGLGNIFVQYQMIHNQTAAGKSWLSLEVFIPISKRENHEALGVSELADAHHQQRYFPEVWTFGIQYANFAKFGPDNSAYHQYEFGGRVSMSSETNSETDFVIHYAFALGLDNSEYSLGTELLGQFLLTGDDVSFTDRTMNQIVFGLAYVKSAFQPKLYYQIPLDDGHNDLIGSVLGLGVDVIIN